MELFEGVSILKYKFPTAKWLTTMNKKVLCRTITTIHTWLPPAVELLSVLNVWFICYPLSQYADTWRILRCLFDDFCCQPLQSIRSSITVSVDVCDEVTFQSLNGDLDEPHAFKSRVSKEFRVTPRVRQRTGKERDSREHEHTRIYRRYMYIYIYIYIYTIYRLQ